MKKCAICSGEPLAFTRTGLPEHGIETRRIGVLVVTANDAIPIQVVRDNLRRWTDSGKACDSLEELFGGCRFALLVEASHGTHEFYQTRAEITERLIREKGFSAVAVEADWPDAYRVNRYVQGATKMPMRQEHSAPLSVSPPGCGATQTWPILSEPGA
jgi:hypothetical protein